MASFLLPSDRKSPIIKNLPGLRGGGFARSGVSAAPGGLEGGWAGLNHLALPWSQFSRPSRFCPPVPFFFSHC